MAAGKVRLALEIPTVLVALDELINAAAGGIAIEALIRETRDDEFGPLAEFAFFVASQGLVDDPMQRNPGDVIAGRLAQRRLLLPVAALVLGLMAPA